MPKLIKESELTQYSKKKFYELQASGDLPLVAENLLHSLKILYDRINQDSSNSSLPPSSNTFDKPRKFDKANDTDNTSDSGKRNANTEIKPLIVKDESPKKQHNKADVRKNRSQGYGRTQKLPVSEVVDLRLKQCQSGCLGAHNRFWDFQVSQNRIASLGGLFFWAARLPLKQASTNTTYLLRHLAPVCLYG